MKFKNKKIIVILVIIFIFLSGCGESDKNEKKTEVIEKKPKIVYPNMSFSASKCLEGISQGSFEGEEISQKWVKNQLVIEVKTYANCCSEKKSGFNFKENEVAVYLFEVGEICLCECVYNFEYTISPIEKKEYKILFKKEKEPL